MDGRCCFVQESLAREEGCELEEDLVGLFLLFVRGGCRGDVEDARAPRAVLGARGVELVARVARDCLEFFAWWCCWCEVVLPEDGIVGVLVDEVAVACEHVAVGRPAEVVFCLLFVHESGGEDVGAA